TVDTDGSTGSGGPWKLKNLTIETGGKVWDNALSTISPFGNTYIEVYGNIICNGVIGSPTGDDISFDIAGGTTCTISGTGSFTAARLRKDNTLNNASNASVIIDMNINLTWSSASGTVLFNDAGAASRLDVTVNSGKTVRCFGPGSIACNVSIDGTNGADGIECGGAYTIYGTLDVDGTFYAKNNNNTNNTSLIIKNGGLVKCRYIDTGPSGTAGNTLTIESGGRLNIFGSVDTVAATLNQTTWNNFSTTNNTWDFQPGSTIEYSGNTRQTINGITQCSNFTVSGGSIKTVGNNFRVDGILTLTNGLLTTSSTNLLTLSSTATCPGGGSFSSFVNGPMRKEGSAAFRFPVGKQAVNRTNLSGTGNVMNGGYRPISISGMTANSNFLAEYQLSNPYLQGPISPDATAVGLQGISRCEYWDLVREAGTQTPTVTLSWSDNSVSGQSQCNVGPYIISPASTFVVPFFNGMWGDQNSSFYGRTGSITTPTSPLFLGEISWDGTSGVIDSYLKFVIGTNNWQQAPLPYDIKNFKATGKGKIVQLDWLINHNDEVRSYVIERSKDGIHFENMKMVPARANEEWAAYVDTDPAPFNGWGYYRLRITDFSGKIGYSNVQKVWMGKAGTYVQVTPKPAKDRLWVNLAEPEKINEMAIVNSVGQLLFKQNRFTNNNQIDISSLRPGVYYVRIVGQNGIFTEPFVKE
ncbi:MAG: T9SS type A sorting domain-containing protein, partial [Bacteroidota bacterium]